MLITIAGNAVTVVHGSVRITNAVGQRSTGSFVVEDLLGTQTFTQGQPVLIQDDNGNTVFSGVVTDSKRVRPTQTAMREHSVSVADWHYLADKRVAPYSAVSKTAGAIANDLISQFLNTEGVYAVRNLLTANQSSVETDTTGFNAVGTGVTLSRDTTTAAFGAASLKVVCDGTNSLQGFNAVVASTEYVAGLTYTLSVYLKGSGTVRLFLYQQSPSIVIGTPTVITLTSQWTRYTVSIPAPNPLVATNYGLRVDTNNVAQAITFWADGLMIEPGTLGITPVTNLFSANQADIETDTTGFEGFVGAAGSLSRDTSQSWHGASSLKVVIDGSGTFQYVVANIDASKFVPSQPYTLSVYAKAATGSPGLRFFIQGDNDFADNGNISSVQTITLSSSGWTRYSVTGTMPATLPAHTIGLRIDTGSPAQALTFWLDGLQMESGVIANAWIPGNTTAGIGPASPWELGGTTSVQAGPTVVSLVSAYGYCSDVLDALVQKAGGGWYWQIDQQKRLWLQSQAVATPAPFVATEDMMERGTIQVTHGQPQYRNKQYMLGGTAQTSTQTETRQGDGKATAFTMSYPFSNTVPTVTLNGVSQTVGSKTANTGSQWYFAPGDPVLAQDSSGTKLVSTDTLQVVYVGQFPNVAVSQDDAAIAAQLAREGNVGTGIVESAVIDTTLTSLSQSFQAASGLLSKYATTQDSIVFLTSQFGLAQGQLLTVNVPADGLNNEAMLIEAITISDVGPNSAEIGTLWYSVTAINGPTGNTPATNWPKFFKNLGQQATQIIGAITVGQSQTLALLNTVTETWAWTESVTETVYACHVPASTLFPASTVLPC